MVYPDQGHGQAIQADPHVIHYHCIAQWALWEVLYDQLIKKDKAQA
jgi:uncharacterized membrane protein YwzB